MNQGFAGCHGGKNWTSRPASIKWYQDSSRKVRRSWLEETLKSMLEVLAYAEKMRWIDSAEDCIGSRKPRNLFIHENRSDLLRFPRALE